MADIGGNALRKRVQQYLLKKHNFTSWAEIRNDHPIWNDLINIFERIQEMMANSTSSPPDVSPLAVSQNASADGDNAVEKVITYVFAVYVPICCLVGLGGTGMVWILIQSQHSLRRLSSNVYLLALSTCSSIFLTLALLTFIDMQVHEPIEQFVHSNGIACKTFTFITYSADSFASWTIVLIAFERSQLLRQKRVRTSRRTALYQTIAVACICVLINLLTLYGAIPVIYTDAQIRCAWRPGAFNELLEKIHEGIHVIGCFAIPALLITILNTFVVMKLRKHIRLRGPGQVTFDSQLTSYITTHRRRSTDPNSIPMRENNGHANSHTCNGVAINEHYTAQTSCLKPSDYTAQPMLHSANKPRAASTRMTEFTTAHSNQSGSAEEAALRSMRKLRRTELDLTWSLLVVTTAYVCMNVPHYANKILRLYFYSAFEYLIVNYRLLYSILNYISYLLMYSHHATIFYLYIFYSPQMKKHLAPTAMKLVECYCLKPVPDFGHDSNDHSPNAV